MAMGKQLTPALHILTLLHITRTVLLVRLNTSEPSPDAHAVQNGRGKLMALLQHFRFLGIALYGFLQCELL